MVSKYPVKPLRPFAPARSHGQFESRAYEVWEQGGTNLEWRAETERRSREPEAQTNGDRSLPQYRAGKCQR